MVSIKIRILGRLKIQSKLVLLFCVFGAHASAKKSDFVTFVEKYNRVKFVPETINWSIENDGDQPYWHLAAEFHLKQDTEGGEKGPAGDIEVHFHSAEQTIVLEQIYLPATMRRQGLLRWFTSLMVLYAREVLIYDPKRIDLEASSIRDSTFPPHIIYAKLGYKPDSVKLLEPIDDSDESYDTPGEFFLGPGPYNDETLHEFEHFLWSPSAFAEMGTENGQLVKRTKEFQEGNIAMTSWAQLPMSLTLSTPETEWIEKQIVYLDHKQEKPKSKIEDLSKHLFERLDS